MVIVEDGGKDEDKAWTKYQVLAVPDRSPLKCALMQLQAVTGAHTHIHSPCVCM